MNSFITKTTNSLVHSDNLDERIHLTENYFTDKINKVMDFQGKLMVIKKELGINRITPTYQIYEDLILNIEKKTIVNTIDAVPLTLNKEALVSDSRYFFFNVYIR